MSPPHDAPPTAGLETDRHDMTGDGQRRRYPALALWRAEVAAGVVHEVGDPLTAAAGWEIIALGSDERAAGLWVTISPRDRAGWAAHADAARGGARAILAATLEDTAA